MRSVPVRGSALLALREARGLKQDDLAALLAKDLGRPIHVTSISKYETEKRQPRPDTFAAICRVLKARGKERQALLKGEAAA